MTMNPLCFKGNEIPEVLPDQGTEAPSDGLTLRSHHCNEHWQWRNAEETILARLSLWWNDAPPWPEGRLGAIGHFHAASPDACQKALTLALRRLKENGCTLAVGPMDGTTWRKYRLVTEPGSLPPFFLEPVNPPDWPAWWKASGFTPLAEYITSQVLDLAKTDPRMERTRQRLADHGLVIRPLNLDHYETELREIYRVSTVSFVSNFLYTPIPEDDFTAQYKALRNLIQPEFVLMAEMQGELVGYFFAIPDLLQARRGVPVETLIGKTLAVLPGKRTGGLGMLLVEELHRQAAAFGFPRVLHALQHQGNSRVRHLSGFYGDVIRRYTLFAHTL